MPSVGVKIYSVFFKLFLRHRLQLLDAAAAGDLGNYAAFGVSCCPDVATAPPNPAFSAATDGVASKDLHCSTSTPTPRSRSAASSPRPRRRPRAHLLAHANSRRTSDPTPTSTVPAGAPYRGYLPRARRRFTAATVWARQRLPIVV